MRARKHQLFKAKWVKAGSGLRELPRSRHTPHTSVLTGANAGSHAHTQSHGHVLKLTHVHSPACTITHTHLCAIPVSTPRHTHARRQVLVCTHMKIYNFTQGALTRVCTHRNAGTHSAHTQAHANSMHTPSRVCALPSTHIRTHPAPWERNKAGGLRVGKEAGGAKAAASLGGRRRAVRGQSQRSPLGYQEGEPPGSGQDPRAPGWEGRLAGLTHPPTPRGPLNTDWLGMRGEDRAPGGMGRAADERP